MESPVNIFLMQYLKIHIVLGNVCHRMNWITIQEYTSSWVGVFANSLISLFISIINSPDNRMSCIVKDWQS